MQWALGGEWQWVWVGLKSVELEPLSGRMTGPVSQAEFKTAY